MYKKQTEKDDRPDLRAFRNIMRLFDIRKWWLAQWGVPREQQATYLMNDEERQELLRGWKKEFQLSEEQQWLIERDVR